MLTRERVRIRLPWWLPFGHVPEIGAAELNERLSTERGPQLLDVRSPGEWRHGHIRSSINVPITELRSRLESLPLDRGRPIVAICLSGHRSIPAVRLLARAGFREVQQLRGGMLAWRHLGFHTEPEAAA
jgi:rhodanese-related sulfurtransferase